MQAIRVIVLAVMILFSLFVSAGAGGLAKWSGAALPVAMLTGGGAFGATLLLQLAAFHFVVG